MTMENGEGRPLDEEEAGKPDPQGWYFDLPTNAWERQEEKNRNLRERVAENIAEDEAQAKNDPFVLRRPEPQPESKGGLFGFGKKKKAQEPPRSEGNGGAGAEAERARPAAGSSRDLEDDWSTEAFAPERPESPFTLRRRTTETDEAPSWGPRDAGWLLGNEADTAGHTAGKAEPGNTNANDGEAGDWVAARAQSAAGDEPSSLKDLSAAGPASLADLPGTMDEQGPSQVEHAVASTVSDETAEPDNTLKLRRRDEAEDPGRLNWGSGPGAWSDTRGDGDGSATGRPGAGREEQGGMMESMKRWAERTKEGGQHGSYVLRHREDEEPETPEPTAIPIRPRHPDEAAGPVARTDEPAQAMPPVDPGAPPSLPLVLRSRTEPQPEAAPTEPNAPPTRWDDFFGLAPQAKEGAEGEEEEGAGGAEGLAAMRDWAARKAEPAPTRDIPPEFLKPFDWETEDGEAEDQPGEIPAEFLKPFEWESDAPEEPTPAAFAWESPAPDETETAPASAFAWESDKQEEPTPAAFAWESPAPDETETAPASAFAWESEQEQEPTPAAFAWESPAPDETEAAPASAFAWESEQEQEPAPPVAFATMNHPAADDVADVEDEDDPLAGLFDHPAPAHGARQEKKPEKKGGLLGRVFGRGKRQDDARTEEGARPAPESWLFAEDDQDEVPAAGHAPRLRLPGEDLGVEEAGQEDWAAFRVNDEEAKPAFASASTMESPLSEPISAERLAADSDDSDDWFAAPTEPTEPGAPFAAMESLPVEPVFEQALAADSDDSDDWFAAPTEPTEPGAPFAAMESLPVEPVFEQALAADSDDSDDWFAAPTEPTEPGAPFAAMESLPVEPVFEQALAADSDDSDVWAPEPVAFIDTSAPTAEAGEVEAAAADTNWPPHQLSLGALSNIVQPGETGAVAEPVAEAPAAEEKPWWEASASEEAVETVASVGPVAEAPAAGEKPWWEASASEEAVETVASVEPVAEAPAAGDKPWWEASASEDAVETAASIEPVAEAPAAGDKPWWEASASEEAVETAASIEPVAEAPAAGDKPWWEASASEDAVETAASIEPEVEAPAAEDTPWAIEPIEKEATESLRVVAPAVSGQETDANDESDDPWAEFVTGDPEADAEAPAAARFASFEPSTPASQPRVQGAPDRDQDMWSEIAAHAEESALSAGDEGIDLAASLESQMAAAAEPPPSWEHRPGRAWEREPVDEEPSAFEPMEEAEDDVILRAFERHAATPDPEPDPARERETEEALAELFGSNAAQIVEESGNQPEPQSFIRLGGFAPQRGTEALDGNWGPEEEALEALERDRRIAVGTDGTGFLVAPWDSETVEGENAHAGSGGKVKTWVRELVETGLLALLVFLSVRASFQNFKVDGNSMLPTLEDGQFLIVNKLVYSEVDMEKLGKYVPFINAGDEPKRNVFHGPQRGDIVVLRDPRKPETDLIKRVIGLPGETVEIVNGRVFINDMLLDEPYITTPWNDTKPKILISEGEYYVLGDNRDNSLDSRSSQVGLIPKDLIIGKAALSYWPRDKFGLAPNEEGSLTEQKPVLTTQRIGED